MYLSLSILRESMKMLLNKQINSNFFTNMKHIQLLHISQMDIEFCDKKKKKKILDSDVKIKVCRESFELLILQSKRRGKLLSRSGTAYFGVTELLSWEVIYYSLAIFMP